MRLYDYSASCNCYKVRLLLAHLGQAYERVPVDIFAGGTLTDEYAAMNPARTTPVLETDDGRFLPESNAILFYLAQGTPFLPDDPLECAEVVRWLVYEQTDVIPTMLLDDHLATREFFVGVRYTIADVAIYGYSHLAHEAGIDMEPYPSLRVWFRRVEQQPGYVEDVEPYGANAAPGAGRSLYD